MVRSFAAEASKPSVTQLIKQLRTSSGAGMMECKKALSESGNNVDEAMDWLRKNGVAKASKKVEGRENAEGQVCLRLSEDCKTATVTKVMSETDFAARSSDFVAMADDLTAIVADSGAEGSFSSEAAVGIEGMRSKLDEAIINIRENIKVDSADHFVAGEEGHFFSAYIHNKAPGSASTGQKLGLVELRVTDGDDHIAAASDVGNKLAMHLVAAKPSYATVASVPAEVIAKEKEILKEQMAGQNKPADVLEKIVTGRMRKFYEENVLEEQPHMVEEGNPVVKKHLNSQCGGIELVNFWVRSIK